MKHEYYTKPYDIPYRLKKKWSVNTAIPDISGHAITVLYVVVSGQSVWCVFEKLDGICLYINPPPQKKNK